MKKSSITYAMLLSLALTFLPEAPAFAGNFFGDMFRGAKAQLSGDNEITDLGDGTVEVTYYAAAAESRKEKHLHWKNLASKACGGGPYTVISKRYKDQVTVDQIIIGIIRCAK